MIRSTARHGEDPRYSGRYGKAATAPAIFRSVIRCRFIFSGKNDELTPDFPSAQKLYMRLGFVTVREADERLYMVRGVQQVEVADASTRRNS